MTTATAMGVSELGRDRGTPPRVAGFPGEGAWVRVRCEDGGTLARGWLSVEPTSAGADGAAVAVVTAGTTPAGDCAIGVWTGRVTADRITPEESGDAPTPMWFAAFVDSVHARTRIDGELETVRQERAQLADSLRDADRRHESRLAELVEDACEFADRHSLCGDFDRFMEERGLPGRVAGSRGRGDGDRASDGQRVGPQPGRCRGRGRRGRRSRHHPQRGRLPFVRLRRRSQSGLKRGRCPGYTRPVETRGRLSEPRRLRRRAVKVREGGVGAQPAPTPARPGTGCAGVWFGVRRHWILARRRRL